MYARFCKWRDEGVLLTIFQELNAEPDFENLSIDSTSIKAHQHSAGAKKAINYEFHQHIGMSRGGKTTKIHTIVDGLGNPILFHLTGGNIFDSTPVCELLDKISIKGSNILGDKAYGSHKIRNYITNHEATYTIPPRSNAKAPWNVDWYLYKERHLVECFSIKSSISVESQQGMISWHLLFSLCVYRCHFRLTQ